MSNRKMLKGSRHYYNLTEDLNLSRVTDIPQNKASSGPKSLFPFHYIRKGGNSVQIISPFMLQDSVWHCVGFFIFFNSKGKNH